MSRRDYQCPSEKRKQSPQIAYLRTPLPQYSQGAFSDVMMHVSLSKGGLIR